MTYTETMYTLARIFDVGNRLLRTAGISIEAYVQPIVERDHSETAYGLMLWLAARQRLDHPWKELAESVVTLRHRVVR